MIAADLLKIQAPGGHDIAAIIVSLFLNTLLSMMWFGPPLFGTSWMQLITSDKGIPLPKGKIKFDMEDFAEATKTRWPYPDYYSYMSSMMCSVIRSFFFFHWFKVLEVTSLAEALPLALFWSLIHITSIDHYFWQGRKIQLAAIDYGHTVSCILLTSVAMTLVPKVLKSAI